MVRRILVVAGLLGVAVGTHVALRFYSSHQSYSVRDPRTGMRFAAFCRYSEHSYRTYVEVRSPGGRLISLQEIPFTADRLADCLQEPHYRITAITADDSYTKLIVAFEGKRPPVELPLALEGIDLPANPRSARTPR